MISEYRDEKRIDRLFAALDAHKADLQNVHLRTLFAREPDRFVRFSCHLDAIVFDYSKNLIVDETMTRLFELARAADIKAWRDRMFAGDKVNTTEDRAVLHAALRGRADDDFCCYGEAVMAPVMDVQRAMGAFAEAVRTGAITGANGARLSDIVNIGIGGSDLGPAMAVAALAPYGNRNLRVHFVSNVDAAHLADTLSTLDAARTLFIVASKTFSTQETMTNARSARRWLTEALGEAAVKYHFAAVSSHGERVRDFGIAPERMFVFWDWVGGRYSIWSAIGLSLMIAIGHENFIQFLDGARCVDAHFRNEPLEKNIPVIMAMLGIWYRNSWDCATHAVIPYDQRLHRFPAYLQQLIMESNGKAVRRDGTPVARATAPVVWGEPGTNAQHAFMQQLHQGPQMIPCDFLVAANASARDAAVLAPAAETGQDDISHHDLLLANCLAQSQALAFGKTPDEVRVELRRSGMSETQVAALAPHRAFPGNRPSNTMIYARLDPYTLGQLIALYEHRTFVEGIVWGINSFDQWGVELGKQLAERLRQPLSMAAHETGPTPAPDGHMDASSAGLIAHIHRLRKHLTPRD